MTFSDLNLDSRVLEAIDAMGYEYPTSIQQHVIPAILQGRDLIATAQTGTGKTAAFLLPIIHELVSVSAEDFAVRALIIAPTRELVQQIDQQFNGMAYFAGLSSIAVYGGGEGGDWERQKMSMIRGAEMVIATPGRMLSHLHLGYLDLSKVRFLVLDEADRMLDMGFHEDIMNILSYLPAKRQNLMFSATMPPEMRKLAGHILSDPVNISLALTKPAEGVLQAAYPVYDNQKLGLLRHLITDRDLKSILIFSATKRNVKEIAEQLARAGLNARAIHSDLAQAERNEVLLRFRNRTLQVLVATDVLSRGIDIDGIDLVINYDIPHDAEDYVHRVGRTARAEATGLAITFVNPSEAKAFVRIERLIEQKIRRLALPEHLGEAPDLEAAAQQRQGRDGRNRSGGGKRRRPDGNRGGRPGSGRNDSPGKRN